MRLNIYRTQLYLAVALFIFIFGQFPVVVETYYSNLLYPAISVIQRTIFSAFPFAVGDFLYVILIATVIWHLMVFSSKSKYSKDVFVAFGLKILNFVLLIYIAFKLLWGLNYNRPSINRQLEISDQPYQKEQLLKLSSFMLKQLKASKQLLAADHNNEYTPIELEDRAASAFNDLAINQPLFEYKHETIKATNSPWALSKMGIEGFYNPLSGEANINTRLPSFILPFVVCHEIAHQIGVAKEDEANLIGYLTAVKTNDCRFKYAAYYNMFRYVLFEIRMKYPEDYNVIITKVPENIKKDFKTEREFWAKYNGAMAGYMNKTFDQILKLNNQEKGIDSYRDIVLWLYNYHKKEL